MVVEADDVVSFATVRTLLTEALVSRGFTDLGRDDEMIALMDHFGDAVSARDYVENSYTFAHAQRNLRVVLTDYPGVKSGSLPYEQPNDPFFQIAIYERRPGGFTQSGLKLVKDMEQILSAGLTSRVETVVPPPQENAVEYWKVTVSLSASLILQWALAFTVTVTITGYLSFQILSRLPLSTVERRGFFVVVSTLLATPLPVPIMVTGGILIPNVIVLPWTAEYYWRVEPWVIGSFSATAALCMVIAGRLFRNVSKPNG